MKLKRLFLIASLSLCGITAVLAQSKFEEVMSRGTLSGNVQLDAQVYFKDSLIGSPEVPEQFRSNSFVYLQYTNGGFSAGLRYEGYFKPMLGYDARLDGYGVPYYFARYSGKMVDFTLGSFYEQFGSGMILRAYQDWNLGLDNVIKGARVIVTPIQGVTIKGLIGTQRHFWENVGMVRGLDVNLDFNDFIKPMQEWETRITLGGSFVSKYQSADDLKLTIEADDNGNLSAYQLKIPKNVALGAVRFGLQSHGFNFDGEYVYKANDPSSENGFIYRSGQALLLNAGYSMKGFGVLLQAKSVDNMSLRGDRNELGNFGFINYMPALTRQHAYSLAALYPYACQSLGEVSFQADIQYKIKKGTVLGGKYGTDLKLNASVAFAPERRNITGTAANPETPAQGSYGYDCRLFHMGRSNNGKTAWEDVYFMDVNLEYQRKFTRNFKLTLMSMYERYNQEVVEGHGFNNLNNFIFVGDFTWMFLKKHALRVELQYLLNPKSINPEGYEERDWLMGTLEYTFAPNWFISVSDQWNVGNVDKNMRLHYYYVSAAYVHDATRISLSYGRIRKGIMCAGGVCREVPASNGIQISLSTSF